MSSIEPTMRAMSPYGAESSRHRKDLIGTVLLGRYRVLSLIGEGAMGLIFLGEHVTIGRKVAIKVLKLYAAKHPQRAKARFIREARMISLIDHENVVWISDFGETPTGLPFFIMEYLEGEDLSVMLLREGPLPWMRVRTIVLQILRALRAAHDAGVIHRDMKPSNCFVLSRGEVNDGVKVLDFGIAKIISGESEENNPHLTQTGEVVGTAAYMAPEQAKGEPLDARTDLYAVGIIIYELLTGVRPFDDPNPVVLLGKQAYELPQPPSTVAPDANITSGLDALVLKAMAKAPDDRFQTANEMISAIESVSAPALSRTDLSGQTLMGRYKLVEKIGEGGMGTVYLGRHLTIGRRLAVKVLHEEYIRLFKGRFLQEAKAASQIAHDNIVKITDYGELPSGQPFLVMEHLDGETLDQTLEREKPLPWARTRRLAAQICRALQAAHDLGIVHRDIKPENIFRVLKDDGDEQLKILDFGIAKMMSEGPKITVTGDIMGTAAYMSPEQARGEKTLDHRTDIYGLGVLLYEMLVGARPFDGVDDYAILYQHVHDPPAPLRLRAPAAQIPADAEAVVLQALAKEPADRFASMRDMLSAILAVQADDSTALGVPATLHTLPSTPPIVTAQAPPASAPLPYYAGPPYPPGPSVVPTPNVYTPPLPTTLINTAQPRPAVWSAKTTNRSQTRAVWITMAVVGPVTVGAIFLLWLASLKTPKNLEINDDPNQIDVQAQIVPAEEHADSDNASRTSGPDNRNSEPDDRTPEPDDRTPEPDDRTPEPDDRTPEPDNAQPTAGSTAADTTDDGPAPGPTPPKPKPKPKPESESKFKCDGFYDVDGNCIPSVIRTPPKKLGEQEIRTTIASTMASVQTCAKTYYRLSGTKIPVRIVVGGATGAVIVDAGQEARDSASEIRPPRGA